LHARPAARLPVRVHNITHRGGLEPPTLFRPVWFPWKIMFLALLPTKRYPLLVRYTATLLIIAIAFALHLAMDAELRQYPFLLFMPGIFLTALLFDKGSGFLATVVTAVLVDYFILPPEQSFTIDPSHLVPLVLFVCIGFAISAVTEALRQTVHKLARSEEQKTLLLEELAHRTKNDLMMISSVLTLQARAQKEPEARKALESAVARVTVFAQAQERLNGDYEGGTVELAEYLQRLCSGLGDVLRDVRPIAVRVHSEKLEVNASRAVSIGLIVNELVTNAFKYAFPDDRGGTVTVTLRKESHQVVIVVSDDGVGCPVEPSKGVGSRLVQLLAAQSAGTIVRDADTAGCRVTTVLPLAAMNSAG
jgi:two-component sensor histidine kinase